MNEHERECPDCGAPWPDITYPCPDCGLSWEDIQAAVDFLIEDAEAQRG